MAINVLIPMSGAGSRFKEKGYQLPKPLIDVNGKPMIQRVVENLNIKGRYIFLVLKEHYDNFDLKNILPKICGENPCGIVIVEKITEGAACTCLLAKHLINNKDELVIANSDQIVEWNSEDFLQTMRNQKADGGILTFTATDPKWSFAKIEANTDLITEVAEKNPISNVATCGVYYWSQGRFCVKSIETMIKKDIRFKQEFYLCPSFNETIKSGKKVYRYQIEKMWGIGIPIDLELYLSQCKS